MGHALYSAEEIASRAKAIYREQISPQLRKADNGKYVVIDIESGDYEMDDDHLAASRRAHERHPDGAFFAMRIGHRTMGRIGAKGRGVGR